MNTAFTTLEPVHRLLLPIICLIHIQWYAHVLVRTVHLAAQHGQIGTMAKSVVNLAPRPTNLSMHGHAKPDVATSLLLSLVAIH